MPYEEIQGEVVTMANDTELGLSGTSTDYKGAQSQTFEVRWNYPGGIANKDWDGINDSNQITKIAESSASRETKINEINGQVYGHVRELLTTHGWDPFYDSYKSCITIRM